MGPLIILALLWVGYFGLHSLLASPPIKQKILASWPRHWPTYRLVYNAVAVGLLVPPLWYMYSIDSPDLWQRRGLLRLAGDAIAAAAIGVFFWSLRFYDMRAFMGTATQGSAKNRLAISPLHRHVRHPWYFLALLIIWTRDMDGAFFLSAILMTLYFWLGSKLEDRKLVEEFGPAYTEYIARVPGLVPWPGKYLTKNQSENLVRNSL